MQLNFSGLPRSLVIVSSSPPICTAVPLQQFSLDGKVRNEVRDVGQGVTQVDYLKAHGPIGLGVALTIDDDEEMYGFTHPSRSEI
ncbi:unnamed protein product [Porites lobata]|uniref:Uncharacterized protein n=1 Tax=Porites lobata TaxID=104759 RepID=A0ABN8RYC9_9CNID|nr:unnamed protein product [Porites lobata]